MPVQAASWREGASAELQAAVEEAMSRLAADEQYERDAPKVCETLDSLDRVANVAWEFATILDQLSTVANSALFAASKQPRDNVHLGGRLVAPVPDLAKVRIDEAIKLSVSISRCSEIAQGFVAVRHMSDGPKEQGGWSSRGKEPDLRAIDYSEDFSGVPFRSPKDKYAVRVIEALIRASHPAGTSNVRNSRALLEAYLDSTWAEMGRNTAVSWTRVIKTRRLIARKLELDRRRHTETLQMRARRNSITSE